MTPRYAILDYETSLLKDGECPRTKFIGLYDGVTYRTFKRTFDLTRYLRGADRMTLLHHGNFDVLQMLVDGAQVKITKSHGAKIIRSEAYGHTMLNTHAIFPVALSRIFAAFGHKKTSLARLGKRNYEDCVWGLGDCLALASEVEEICGVNPLTRGTMASTGMRACELVAGKMPQENRFESAFRGGRVEMFWGGEWLARKFDINSSYPFSILDVPPTITLRHVWVKVSDFWCPFFTETIKDKLVFPNGTFTTWIFDDVFERYIEPYVDKACVRTISKHKIRTEWLQGIKPLIQSVYNLKQTSKGARREAAKLFVNAVYGRFGLRGEHETPIFARNVAASDDLVYFPLGRGRYLSFKTMFRPTRHNFAFAAYITDNARARLYKAFAKNGGLYGDTDSVFTVQPFAENEGTACGDWKNEGKHNLKLTGLKDYRWKNRFVIKGGKHHFQWTLKQFAAGETVKEITRTRGLPVTKRRCHADGSTTPLIMSA